jgi:TorA maturation chaperone TorD
MGTTPIQVRPPIAPEDQARADMYALLARLYADAPDANLLSALAGAPPIVAEGERAEELAAAWDALTRGATAMDADAARQEYQDLFIGVGKSEVNLHASYHLTGFMMEEPLAEVRTTLVRLGLGRQAQTGLVEDHLAVIFETMRVLIAGTLEILPASSAVQQSFLEQHIVPWYALCCGAIQASPIANYYRLVAKLTTIFIGLEAEAFAIDE